MAATRTFLQTAVSTTSASTYTFSSQNFGTESADRYIVAAAVGRSDDATGTITLDSVSIGGEAATLSVNHRNTGGSNITFAAFAIAHVPTGTTGDVVVTFSGAILRCGIALYSATSVDPTPTDTGVSSANDPTTSLDVAAGGIAFATGYTSQASAADSVAGVTEDYDTIVSANSSFVGGSDEFATLQTGLTVTIDFATPLSSAGVFVSYPEAVAVDSFTPQAFWFV